MSSITIMSCRVADLQPSTRVYLLLHLPILGLSHFSPVAHLSVGEGEPGGAVASLLHVPGNQLHVVVRAGAHSHRVPRLGERGRDREREKDVEESKSTDIEGSFLVRQPSARLRGSLQSKYCQRCLSANYLAQWKICKGTCVFQKIKPYPLQDLNPGP